jgi:iron complex outermembrane receptor protein
MKLTAMQPKQTIVLATMLCAGSSTVIAQELETIDSVRQKQQMLQPIEVRGLRATQDAPFAKTELSRRDIEKQNLGQDIPYLLQYTPSAVTTSDAGAGVGYTGLRVRGTDGQRINVTLNGIPVNDGESQGVFFVNTPDLASSTGSIQLQRGVGSSTNGGAAFGATMSISNLLQFEKAGAEISEGFGSFNTWRHTLRAGTGLLKNGLQFDVRLSKISSDGYMQRSASDLKALQFIAGWQANKNTSVRFMMMTGQEKTGQAWNGVPQDSLQTNRTFNGLGLKSDGYYYNDQTDNYQQDYYQGFVDHKFSKYLSGHLGLFLTRGRGYYQEYRMGDAYADYGLPDFISGTDTVTTTDLTRQLWLDNYYYGSVFSLIYEKNKTQLTLGGGWNQYDGEHYGFVKWAQFNIPVDYRWYNLTSQKNDINVYLKAQQKLTEKLIAYGDLQYRRVDYDINGFRKNPTIMPSVDYNFFNPKAGLTYFIENSSRKRQKVYGSVAVANKEPNRDDFEASVVNLPKPERLTDVEVGYEMNTKKWSAAANLYYMMYKDQLVLTGKINDVGAYARTNVDKSFRRGIELQGGVVPFEWMRAFANATFSENKIDNFTEFQDDYDNPTGEQIAIQHGQTDIAFSPNLIAAGGLTFTPFTNMAEGNSFEFDLMAKHVGKQYLDNTSNDARKINAYSLFDVRIRYAVQIRPFREVAASLALNNIFNKMYESNGYTFTYKYGGALTTENFYFPQAGFNWLAGLTLKW